MNCYSERTGEVRRDAEPHEFELQTLTIFHLLKLPLEIQLLVWESAVLELPSRVVEVTYKSSMSGIQLSLNSRSETDPILLEQQFAMAHSVVLQN
jgi:hypothetical protein